MQAESEKLLKVLVEAENVKEAGVWQILSEPIMRTGGVEVEPGCFYWMFCVIMRLYHRKSGKQITFVACEMHPDFDRFVDLVPGQRFKFGYTEQPLYDCTLTPHISAHLTLRLPSNT